MRFTCMTEDLEFEIGLAIHFMRKGDCKSIIENKIRFNTMEWE